MAQIFGYCSVIFKYDNARSIATTPFRLMFGTHARLRDDDNIRQLLENEWVTSFQENRDEMRVRAKESIAKIQEENRCVFNKTYLIKNVKKRDYIVKVTWLLSSGHSRLLD